MKKSLLGAALTATAMIIGEPVEIMAQETYEGAQIATHDLNGTAHYIGMGGAMEALGADISTMSTNPAGIGLFRRSWAGASAGLTIQSGNSVAGVSTSGKTNADLNQAGFVFTMPTGANSSFNFGANFHKNRNFNQIISAVNSLDGNYSSANKLMYLKYAGFSQRFDSKDDGFSALSQAERLTYNTVNYQLYDELQDYDYYKGATGYVAQRDNSGYIGEYDFNFSGNINDRIYLGLTFGLKDVHYNSELKYEEAFPEDSQYGTGGFGLYDNRKVTGTGFDFKFGAIIRPIEESPFRFGLYINTPTWYTLTCRSNMYADGYFSKGEELTQQETNAYDYKIVTPWKFGVSLGHTFGTSVALGLTYEYSDYSTIKNLIVEGYNGYGQAYTSDDNAMNSNTKYCLKGVHLLKAGIEYRPVSYFAVRLGYNFESAMYNDYGSKDYTIDCDLDYGSVGGYYSTYDYTNWKATHRVTMGLGWTFCKNWTADLSYQYITQQGQFHPFETVEDSDPEWACYGTPYDVTNTRHQINCTLSYRF